MIFQRRFAIRLLKRLALIRSVRRERRALAALPPHLLRDIGLSRPVAQREARRPVWDLPHCRRDAARATKTSPPSSAPIRQ